MKEESLKSTYIHMTYSNDLNTKLTAWLLVDPTTFSEDQIRIGLENAADDAEQKVQDCIGRIEVQEDVVIPKDVINEMIQAQRLYSAFMAEYDKI